jgi:predicted dienelactone hydrolase
VDHLEEEVPLVDESRRVRLDCRVFRPRETSNPMPVAIFSVPMTWFPDRPSPAAAYLGRHLARAGYCAVHVRHTDSDKDIFSGSLADRTDLKRYVDDQCSDPSAYRNRFLDVPFLLDRIADWNAEGLLANRLDLNRIGISGYSFGAVTALSTIGQELGPDRQSWSDPRIRAAISFGYSVMDRYEPETAYLNLNRPALFVTGTEDFSYHAPKPPIEKLNGFFLGRATQHYAVMLKGADHHTFGGGRAETGRAGRRERLCHQLIAALTLAFWDAYLRDDPQARHWLDLELPRVLGRDGQSWRR